MAELNLTANGTEQERILAYLQLCNRILVSSFGNSPVNIVCVIRASKEVKNRGAFNAAIINYVMVIAFIFEYGYFVYIAFKTVYMGDSSVGIHIILSPKFLIRDSRENTNRNICLYATKVRVLCCRQSPSIQLHNRHCQ